MICRKYAVAALFRPDGMGAVVSVLYAEIRWGNADGTYRSPFPFELGRYCCTNYLTGYWTFKKSLPNGRSLIERADKRIASIRTIARSVSSHIAAVLLWGLLQLQMLLYFVSCWGS